MALLRNMAISQNIVEIKQKEDALLLYPAEIDMTQVEKLINALHGRVLLRPGPKPFIRVRMRSGRTPLEFLRELLSLLSE